MTAGKAMESCKTNAPMPYTGISGLFPMVMRMLIRIGGASTYDKLDELAHPFKLRGFGFIIIRTCNINNSAYLRMLHESDSISRFSSKKS